MVTGDGQPAATAALDAQPTSAELLAAVHLVLVRDGTVLLIRRHNTGYEDGNYSLIAGHIEPDEPALAAMQREAEEEAGITIAADDLDFVHIMHRNAADAVRLDFFFRCTTWSGHLRNAEPHKCAAMSWHHPAALPTNTIPYIRSALGHIVAGKRFSEHGWP